MVKQVSWAVEKFPTFDDDNQSDDDNNDQASNHNEVKEFRKRVNSFEVATAVNGVSLREAGFLSIEKDT
jgi:hypothetical protein